MPESKRVDLTQRPSLSQSLQSFWSVLVAIFYTRLDLAAAELEELAKRTAELVAVSLAAILCVTLTFFFFFIFLIVILWAYKEIVVSVIFGVCVVASIALVATAKAMIAKRPKLLEQTLIELRRDVEGMRASVQKDQQP